MLHKHEGSQRNLKIDEEVKAWHSLLSDIAIVILLIARASAVVLVVVPHHGNGLLYKGCPHHGAIKDHILLPGHTVPLLMGCAWKKSRRMSVMLLQLALMLPG